MKEASSLDTTYRAVRHYYRTINRSEGCIANRFIEIFAFSSTASIILHLPLLPRSN